jgi:hypothetical protein
MAYVIALAPVRTIESSEAQLSQFMNMLRLYQCDDIGFRDAVPPLMLRLNLDQTCYDFLKWWAMATMDPEYKFDDTWIAYPNVRNSNVFEDVDCFVLQPHSRPPELGDTISHTVSLTLLKIRLLFELERIEELASVLRLKLPQEIVDEILQLVPENRAVSANRRAMDYETLSAEINRVRSQIQTLYKQVNDLNGHFWPALLNPQDHLLEIPFSAAPGAVEDMKPILIRNWAAWVETPGAIEFIRKFKGFGN